MSYSGIKGSLRYSTNPLTTNPWFFEIYRYAIGFGDKLWHRTASIPPRRLKTKVIIRALRVLRVESLPGET
jgi:hypothetical protein